MSGAGRSPAQIDADVARLKEGIRRARDAAGAGRARPDGVSYQDAVAKVAQATRELVDYEARIPLYTQEYRQHQGARLSRRAGLALAAVCLGLCLAVLPGAVDGWWLALDGPLLLAGLLALPGADRRAADAGFRPRLGAGLFAVAVLVAILCSSDLVTAWACPLAPLDAWIGLRAFGSLGSTTTVYPFGADQPGSGT